MKHRNLFLAAGVVGLLGAGIAADRSRQVRATRHAATERELPHASLLDTVSTVLEVFVPTFAKGVVIRRPGTVDMAERMELDSRAVRRMQKLRAKYGQGPLMLRLPMRKQALVLAPEHVHRVLAGSPQPFATASSEKRAALSHFEPQGVLVSHGAERADRRRYNEEVLESESPVHRLAESFLPYVEQEAAGILTVARERRELSWDDFAEGWFRLVRRVLFGNAASEDHELTQMIAELRSAANWAFLRKRDTGLQEKLFARIEEYLKRAEPGSLAAVMANTRTTSMTMPQQQVPQWLFAFDPAGMATMRSLALLATHPEEAASVQEEIRSHPGMMRQELPLLRAAVLESLRLWPTSPLVLRQTTEETHWENGTMPAGTGIAIFAPFFHRDDERRVYAHRFTPELWLRKRTANDWPLIPFSGGPAICPGRNLVLMLSSAMLAALLDGRRFYLKAPHRLDPDRLPGTLNNYALRFRFTE